ncbi:MAG: hypothetical protein GAK39_04181 [Variovorax sp.]|nr:MAG: hypothetical protein GAK39_04181 [Variovorax sp.]
MPRTPCDSKDSRIRRSVCASSFELPMISGVWPGAVTVSMPLTTSPQKGLATSSTTTPMAWPMPDLSARAELFTL